MVLNKRLHSFIIEFYDIPDIHLHASSIWQAPILDHLPLWAARSVGLPFGLRKLRIQTSSVE